MDAYCVSWKKKSSSVRRTRQNRLMLVSNYAICGQKKIKLH